MLIETILNVRSEAELERAIASEVASTDDTDLTESFLNQMSTQYRPDKVKETTTVVEDPSNEGQDSIQRN